MWDSMIAATRAAIARRNGIRSKASSEAGSASKTGRSRWESSVVRPIPGKCLATAMTPRDCRPSITAAPMRPVCSGSGPNIRPPMTLAKPSGATSTTGARFMLIPTPQSSRAQTSANSAACRAFVIDGLPGNWVNGGPRRATGPPSWSMETISGGWPQSRAQSWAARQSSASCAGDSTLRLNRISPPTRRPDTRCSSSALKRVP